LAERGNWQNVMGATLSALSEKEILRHLHF